MKRYAFTPAHARALVWTGRMVFGAVLAVGALAVVAGVTEGLGLYVDGKGLPAAIAGTLAEAVAEFLGGMLALAIATSFIVAGHLILIFLDQRTLPANHLGVARMIRRALRRHGYTVRPR
jgi:hypothetical protein